MSTIDTEDVLNYLSIKFNKIFCDRDFVCCVIQDFQTVLTKKNKPCVLVFPTLGPIYLKALRYQAKLFDLAVFNVASTSGKYKSLAVCHKDDLAAKNPVKEETMADFSSKRKRPERQLYVPPAQRRSSRISSKNVDKKTSPLKLTTETTTTVINNNNNNNNNDAKDILLCDEHSSEIQSVDLGVQFELSDLVNMFYGIFHDFAKKSKHHTNCAFKQYLLFKNIDSKLNFNESISIYPNSEISYDNRWKLDYFYHTNNHYRSYFKSYPIFEEISNDGIESKPDRGILVSYETSYFFETVKNFAETESLYGIVCDNYCDQLENDILDLSLFNLGHYFLIDSCDFFECQEIHDVADCYLNTKKKFEEIKNAKNIEINNANTIPVQSPKEHQTSKQKNNKEIVQSKTNRNEKKVSNNKNEHEQEKEIMRKTKENINRKTKPIMKYVDDSNDTLKIDKNDGVNNWEDLFDDNGQIQEEFLTEIVDKVGDNIKIIKAAEDYTAYTSKPSEELEHIVELYNFPSTLATHDLVQAFSDINSDAMYIKWVDDTHALLVLGSSSQAQKAVNMRNPLIKVRPMSAASAVSIDVANKSDLRPAMKRPPTNLQTARRLITSHLGTKSKLSKEQMAKEREDLKHAREMKRMIKQNERDAWEGNIRSSLN